MTLRELAARISELPDTEQDKKAIFKSWVDDQPEFEIDNLEWVDNENPCGELYIETLDLGYEGSECGFVLTD